jgi:hypothetical protein
MLADPFAELENNWEREIAACIFLHFSARERKSAPTVPGETTELDQQLDLIEPETRGRIATTIQNLKRLPTGWAIECCRGITETSAVK